MIDCDNMGDGDVGGREADYDQRRYELLHVYPPILFAYCVEKARS